MSNGGKTPNALLEQLSAFMAREVEEASDEELLDEIAGGRTGALARVDQLKRHLQARVAKARRERLERGRRAYDSATQLRGVCESCVRPSVEEIRRRIAELFNQGAAATMGLAFRNGEHQSDADLISLWDQLCELGAVSGKDYG